MHILIGNGNVPHRECTSSLGMGMCLTGNAYPHWKWECASPGLHILTGNGNVPHRECTCSPRMGMCLTGNAHPHREWECASPGMHILTENGNIPHGECISSPGMHIVYTGWDNSRQRTILRAFSRGHLGCLPIFQDCI